MKLSIRAIIVLLFFANITFGQKHLTTTVGYALPILDGGNGIHLGLNPSYDLSQFFAIEGQLSYTYARINKFISGERANQNSYNAVAGGRLYIVDAEKSFQPYICLLYTSPSPRDRQKSRMPSSA